MTEQKTVSAVEELSESVRQKWTGVQPVSWVVVDGVLSVFDGNGKLLAFGNPADVVVYFNDKE